MAEEHRCQPPQLCANNCGFFGSPATQNLCSKCHRDLQHKEQQSSSAKLVLNQTLTTATGATASAYSSCSSVSSSSNASSAIATPLASPEGESEVISGERVGTKPAEEVVQVAAHPNRCLTCRRRVGVTGFKCRCGMTFCGTHRYPEQHACSFDFKGMGKEQIAKANPIVRAEKLDKI